MRNTEMNKFVDVIVCCCCCCFYRLFSRKHWMHWLWPNSLSTLNIWYGRQFVDARIDRPFSRCAIFPSTHTYFYEWICIVSWCSGFFPVLVSQQQLIKVEMSNDGDQFFFTSTEYKISAALAVSRRFYWNIENSRMGISHCFGVYLEGMVFLWVTEVRFIWRRIDRNIES